MRDVAHRRTIRSRGDDATGRGRMGTESGEYPFDTSGIEVGADGIRRYTDLPVNLVQLLRAQGATRGDRPAVVELGGPSLTYSELWQRAMRVAGGLRNAGVATGDRVAVQLGNGVDWTLAFWGAQLAGAVVVPMNTRLAQAEAEFILADCAAKYVVRPGEPLPDGEPGELPDPAHTDVAALFYTSGTTGRPKGAMTTHENFLTTIETVIRCRELSRAPGVRHATLISVPLFHVTGCNSQFLTQIALGGTSVIMPRFDPASFLAAIPEYGITLVTSVPTIYELVLRHPDVATTDGVHRADAQLWGRTHRSGTCVPPAGGVPDGAARQRLRPERDLGAGHVPAARVRDRARRRRRVPGSRERRPHRPARPGHRGRRTADPGAERRRRVLGRPGADGGDVRRRLAAHGRPSPHRRRDRADRRPREGHDQPRRRERVQRRGGEHPGRTSGRARGR